MIKFVDLNTGYLYDGESPYIHWFPGEQSTDLIYTHKICLISSSTNIDVELDSEVFNLIDTKKISDTSTYKDIISKKITSEHSNLSNGYFVHMIYFSASSKNGGEYRTNVKLTEDENEYNIIIGADFYIENEPLYINLSNLGVELPDAIQKALYSVDIKESYRDNITLNRKMKELLSNYWDMIANKGSYKSLLNTLKWFEWGDLIKIREIWKHEDFGRTVYDDRDLCSILEDKYLDTLNEFNKTTHLALYVSMQEIMKQDDKILYDDELNPILKNIVIPKWSKNDLLLKICLLGNFYETYFMPIHLNLFQATIEDIVFTNTSKIFNALLLDRHDHVCNIDTFKCNVKNNSTYILDNVQCQVGPNTMFGTQWQGEEAYRDIHIMGVEDVILETIDSNNNLKTFYSQLYKGVGVIIPFECEMDALEGDYIVESRLYMNDISLLDNTIIHPEKIDNKYKFNVNFKLLFQREVKHQINVQFKTAGSKLYTKSININIIDVSGMDLKIYKVKHYKYLDDDYISLLSGHEMNNYIFKRYPRYIEDLETPMFTIQYIPTVSSIKTSGVCLNNILILRGDYRNDYLLKQYYFMTVRDGSVIDENNNYIYTVCVSRSFWFNPEINIIGFKKDYLPNVYRNDYGFFPEFHYLEEINKNKLSNYTITDEDVIAIIPQLPLGLSVDGWDWEFKNVSRDEIIQLPDYQEPYINDLKESPLSTGYYDVTFKYRIGQDRKSITRESIFCKF